MVLVFASKSECCVLFPPWLNTHVASRPFRQPVFVLSIKLDALKRTYTCCTRGGESHKLSNQPNTPGRWLPSVRTRNQPCLVLFIALQPRGQLPPSRGPLIDFAVYLPPKYNTRKDEREPIRLPIVEQSTPSPHLQTLDLFAALPTAARLVVGLVYRSRMLRAAKRHRRVPF